MKLIILCGLIGLSLASLPSYGRRDINEVEFRAEREFRYHFDGHLSTALPISESQKAITRIQSLVSIQPESSEYWFRMQLRNLRWATSQEQLDSLRIQPFEEMEQVDLDKEQQRLLSLPIRFNYKHGLVGDIEFDGEDQVWAKNIKKSIVNMLQINYIKKGVESREMIEDERIHKNDYFTTVERTLEGECEVAYTRIEESKEFEQWTKSVNFEKCTVRPEVRYGRRFVEKCEECEKTVSDEKLSSTVMTFNITHGRSDKQFLIRDVELRSQHLFAPVSEKNQLVVSYVYNKLNLVYAGEVEKTIEKINGEEKETLVYNSMMEIAEEKFAMTGDEKYLRHIPMWSNKVEIIKNIFNKMMKDIESGIELETTHLLARLVKVLRFCTEHEIQSVERYLSETEKMSEKTVEKMRQFFYDSLALSGTKTTIHHLLEKMNNKKTITPVKAAQLMKMLAEVRVPSDLIAEEVYNFCETDVSARNPLLRQSCWLTYGSIVSGFCGNTENKMALELNEKMCTRSLKQKIVDQLIRKFESAETRYEKVLFVKTLSNAAIDVSVYSLNKIISDKKEEKTVRLQAIEALRRLRTVMPRKIQYVLMPIYKNRMELPELRMTALNVILMTRPEESILSQVVEQVVVERNRQVRFFSFNALRTLSKSTNPCEKTLAIRANKVLRLIPTELEQTIMDSRLNRWTLYNNEYMTGASLNWATLFTSDSILPKEIMASLDSVFGGEWNKYLAQVGLYQNNMDVILNKMIRKIEETGLEKLVVRGKRSATFRPAELLRTIAQKLRINRREMINDEPEALLYFRYKDMDYAFLPIDMDTLPELLKKIAQEGRIELGEIERVLAHGLHYTLSGAVFVHETIRKIPTALGMPVVLGSKMPTLASVQGHIKFEFEPKSSDRFNGLRLRLVAQPQIASTHIIKLEVRNPVVYSGVKLIHGARINTPVDLEMIVNWENRLTIKTVFKTPETKQHLVTLMSRPVTYVAVWDKETRHYPEAVETTVFLKNSRIPMETVDRVYFEETGMKLTVSGSIRRPFFLLSEEQYKTVLVGDNLIHIWYEPKTQNVREVVFNMEMELFEPVNRMEKPTFESFFEKKTMNKYNSEEEFDFETEKVEYKTESEEVRRREFTKYIKNLEIVKAYKHSIVFKVETVGDIRKKMETEVRAICDDKVRYCRVNVEARRSPIGEESREWELKAFAQTLYPEMPKTFKQMYEQVHREFNGIVEIQWGAEEKNTMNLKLQGEQNREQKVWMKKMEREQTDLSETKMLLEAAKLNQYKIDAEYKLTPTTKYYLRDLLTLLKSRNFMNTEVDVTKKTQEGNMQVKLTIEPINRRFCSLVLETPESRVLFNNIVVPFQFPTMNIRRNFGSIHSVKHVVERIEKENRAECIVKSKEVQTFDNLFYKAPITPCFHVLAKDCSSEIPRFNVLLRKMNKNTEEKELKINNEGNLIVLRFHKNQMTVYVNNEIIKSVEKMEQYGIYQITEELYKIDIEDVLVHFDGYEAKIQLSTLYKNKQCGLCGHYDNEEINEFRRADNIETSDIKEFHNSYLYQDDECEMDTYELNKESNYRLIDEESRYDNEYDVKTDAEEPVLRTRVLERGQRICFSTEPLPECLNEMKGRDTYNKIASFRCLRRSAPLADRLVREIRRENVLTSDLLEEVEETYEQKLRLPKMCLAF